MERRQILKSLAAIPLIGIEPNEAKPAKSVVVRAVCNCEGFVKYTITADEHGWYTFPESICSKCLGLVTHCVHDEDNPNLKPNLETKP